LNLEHLQGHVYHMVSINNLPSIFAQKAILSKQRLDQLKISCTSIANEEVQQLRSRIFVFDAEIQKYRSLHSYVPFYFAQHTPMLYIQYTNGLQKDIVIFEVSRTILATQGVIFTNGNATIQQLSKIGAEKVGITPATTNKPFCQRTYKPDNTPFRNKHKSLGFLQQYYFSK
jgi:ssDNA thymidine ADP-ribosyltransferase DarT-like protein